MASGKKDTVGATSVLYDEQAADWDRLHDVLGGTAAMRLAGHKWLPQEPKETPDAYNARKSRSFLFGKFKRTLEDIVGRPFSEPVTLENAPEWVEEIAKDVDRSGTTLSAFAKQFMMEAIKYGRSHSLVDFPKMPENATRLDELRGRPRPIFQLITPPNLIAWQTTMNEDTGEVIPVHVRWRETRVERDPETAYLDKRVNYVRVFNSETFELWKQDEDDTDKYTLVPEESGVHTFGTGGVPLETANLCGRGDPFVSSMPFSDLIWSNIEHWQSASDQRNVLRFTRCGFLFVKGLTQAEYDTQQIVVGVNQVLKTTSTDADAKHVNYEGEGTAAGERDLDRINKDMEQLGADPFVRRMGVDLATVSVMHETKSVAVVVGWIRVIEDALRKMFEKAGTWIGQTLPEEFKVNVYSDFVLGLGMDSLEALDRARARGDVSRETFLGELRRRGVLAEQVDVIEELGRIEREPPPLALVGSAGIGADGDESGDDVEADEKE